MNTTIIKTNSNQNRDRYEMFGTHAERMALSTDDKSRMAAGSYFVETDANGNHSIYMWDEATQSWGEF